MDKQTLEKELIKQLREQAFIDKEMVKITYQNDAIVKDGTIQAILRVGVDVDKEKLEKWLDLCVKLESIDESTLIDIAISKKFKELNDKIYQLKQELKHYKGIYEDFILKERKECQNQDF